MKISAVIFDLDGTLVDSEGEWGMAFTEVLKELGQTPSKNHPQTRGVPIRKNWEVMLNELNLKTNKNLDELEAATYNNYIKHVPTVTLKPGAIEFVESLKDSGVKVGLATSANWLIVEMVFKRLYLNDIFDSVTTGEEVLNEKPDPDIFLVTADKLGEKEEFCLVIEDSPSGIMAAHRAGMKVIAIEDGEDDQPDLSGADLIVGGFAEITPKVIADLGET
jgi:sugar-phosphatase